MALVPHGDSHGPLKQDMGGKYCPEPNCEVNAGRFPHCPNCDNTGR